MLKLTDLEGDPLFVDEDSITVVQMPSKTGKAWEAGGRAVIHIYGGNNFVVKDPVGRVIDLMKVEERGF